MRLVTRSDFDGLVCGMLLMKKNAMDSWKFVHPKDFQDGKFETSKIDILANVPYVEGYNEQSVLFKKMLEDKTKVYGNVIVTDLRDVDVINAGNRFMIYSLFPEQNVSLWVVDGRNKANVSIATGYSVLNRTCDKDIGSLMLSYGGGGHKQVGTCQVENEDADRIIKEIVDFLSE